MEHAGSAVVMTGVAGLLSLAWLVLFLLSIVRASRRGAPPAAATPAPAAEGAARARSPERLDWRQLGELLAGDVHGQDVGIAMVLDELRARLALPERKAAACSFLFVGPPGVGKTEVGRRLAARLGRHLVDVDMATLKTSPDVALSGALAAHPPAVLVLDDVDKADPAFFPMLKWILEGEAITAPGAGAAAVVASARQAVVILTTSAGHEKLPDVQALRGAALEDALRRIVLAAGAVPKDLLSRVDCLVPFVPLTQVAMLAVIEDVIRETAATMKVEVVELPPAVLAHVFRNAGGKDFGVLALRKAVERAIAPKLAAYKGGKVRLHVVRDALVVEVVR